MKYEADVIVKMDFLVSRFLEYVTLSPNPDPYFEIIQQAKRVQDPRSLEPEVRRFISGACGTMTPEDREYVEALALLPICLLARELTRTPEGYLVDECTYQFHTRLSELMALVEHHKARRAGNAPLKLQGWS